MTVLQMTDIWFGYDEKNPVVRGVSLSVKAGETVALLGPNGAGKTTLTKLMVALLQPGRGEVLVGGESTRGQAPEDVASRAAYVFQHSDQQLFAITVEGEVAFGPRQLGRTPAEVASDVESALERVGLGARRETHPYDLPPAERKLVALAAALAQRPQLLVLDEPTQGLDRTGKARVTRVIQSVAEQGGAVIAVTHDLGVVGDVLDRAVVLEHGAVVSDGPAARVVAGSRAVTARVSAALRLPGTPVRTADVVAGVRAAMGGAK